MPLLWKGLNNSVYKSEKQVPVYPLKELYTAFCFLLRSCIILNCFSNCSRKQNVKCVNIQFETWEVEVLNICWYCTYIDKYNMSLLDGCLLGFHFLYSPFLQIHNKEWHLNINNIYFQKLTNFKSTTHRNAVNPLYWDHTSFLVREEMYSFFNTCLVLF